MTALRKSIGAALGTDDEELIKGHVEALHQDMTYSIMDMEDLSEDMQGARRARQLQLELDGLKKSNLQREKEAEESKITAEQNVKISDAKDFISKGIKTAEDKAQSLTYIAPALGYDPTEVVFDLLTEAFEQGLDMTVDDAISRANTHFAAEEERLREKLGMAPEKKSKKRRRKTTSSATAGSSTGGKKKLSIKEAKEQAMADAMKNF